MDEILASSWQKVEKTIESALAEDLSRGDATTEALIRPDQQGRAAIIARGGGGGVWGGGGQGGFSAR